MSNHVTYEAEDMNKIIDYLVTQPYKDAAPLIHILQAKQVVPEPPKTDE